MKIGILALQGAVEPHEIKLKELGVEVCKVRRPEHLSGLSGIILPGGESSTMLHLLKVNNLWDPLAEFIQKTPAWGICAGAILLAHRVLHPEQKSFQALNITVERNAYGRQNESFSAELNATEEWSGKKPVLGVFIRAPRITEVGTSVKTLLKFKDEAVFVEEKNVLASSFHPELTDSNQIHQYFLEKC